MRLIGINNTYPPTSLGGYGEACADVMGGLASRGHDVTMLVCGDRMQPLPPPPAAAASPVVVRRELDYALAPWRNPRAGLRATRHDARIVRAAIAEGVDAALVWHCRGIVKTSLRLLHDAGVPVLYQLHDRWVLYERPGSLALPWGRLDRLGARRPRELLGRILSSRIELRSPPIERDGTVCFVSRWLQEEHTRRGFDPRDTRIVPCGVNPEAFSRTRPPQAPPKRLLFAGRVEPRKGLHTAVRALAKVDAEVTLTVAGPEEVADYLSEVRLLAGQLGLTDRVRWIGEVSRTRMPDLLADHDVLLFPSIGVEAYALGILEALVAGRLVITSASGGPQEYLRDGRNALLHEPGDVDALASAIDGLRADPDLAGRLLEGAAITAREISLAAVLDQLEDLLAERTRPPTVS